VAQQGKLTARLFGLQMRQAAHEVLALSHCGSISGSECGEELV